MESEANLSQDEALVEVEQAPAAPEEVEAPEAKGESEVTTATAVDAASDAAVAASDASDESAKAEAEASTDVVATDDVAHARSRMDLARIKKETLIEQAEQLADSTDWRATSEAQRELMDQWRKAGYAGKDSNDALWDRFRAARQTFFSHREEAVLAIKAKIVEDAKAATENITNWVGTSKVLDGLMDQWKAAGNSGNQERDKELWDQFNGIRRDFRSRRKADLDKRRATNQANADAKRAIVEEAKQIAESKEYTREHSDRMRQLDKDYKAIGFAGKPANDTLWAEFSKAKNSYWTGNTAYLDERRQRRSERLQEVVDRKSEQIEHLKTQNETLTARLGSAIDPKKLAQIKSWIAQNEERVDDLEDDIGDIKSKI